MRSVGGVPFSLNWENAYVPSDEEDMPSTHRIASSNQRYNLPNIPFPIELVSDTTMSDCSISQLTNGEISLMFPTLDSTTTTMSDASVPLATAPDSSRRQPQSYSARGRPSVENKRMRSFRSSFESPRPRRGKSLDSCGAATVEEATKGFLAMSEPASASYLNAFQTSNALKKQKKINFIPAPILTTKPPINKIPAGKSARPPIPPLKISAITAKQEEPLKYKAPPRIEEHHPRLQEIQRTPLTQGQHEPLQPICANSSSSSSSEVALSEQTEKERRPMMCIFSRIFSCFCTGSQQQEPDSAW